MFMFVGGVLVNIPHHTRVPKVETKPLELYPHSIDYHVLTENPHTVTAEMAGVSDCTDGESK